MRNHSLDCRGYKINLGSQSHIMGILNVTPDSFSDGGEYTSVEKALAYAKTMVLDGASIIDIGGESTRPGSLPVDETVEINRVAPIIETFKKEVKVPLSLDTYKAKVAEKALALGVHMINDIWGLQKDPEMAGIIAQYQVPVVIMHNQAHNHYELDLMDSIKAFLAKSVDIAIKAGIKEKKIIIDPGIGFGKNYQQNIQVLSRLQELKQMGFPILLGASRKSFIGYILDLPPKERVEGTIATTVMGISKGADIFRVHDIKENYRAAMFTDKIVGRKMEE